MSAIPPRGPPWTEGQQCSPCTPLMPTCWVPPPQVLRGDLQCQWEPGAGEEIRRLVHLRQEPPCPDLPPEPDAGARPGLHDPPDAVCAGDPQTCPFHPGICWAFSMSSPWLSPGPSCRSNNYLQDPLSRCRGCDPPQNAENAISARSDLNPSNGTYPFPALRQRCHGGIDMKVCPPGSPARAPPWGPAALQGCAAHPQC